MALTAKMRVKRLADDLLDFEPVMLKDARIISNEEAVPSVKQYLAKHGLTEKEDYKVVEDKESHYGSYGHKRFLIQFSGKSLVVRALWSVPQDLIDFETPSISRQRYVEAKQVYAVKISAKECFEHDTQFVREAHAEDYRQMKQVIQQIHNEAAAKTEMKQVSLVVQTLNTDLFFIDQIKENTNPRIMSKSYLALVSLAYAHEQEKAKPTLCVKKNAISNMLFKPESSLLPLYRAALDLVCRAMNSTYEKKLPQFLQDYQEQVAAKQKELQIQAGLAVQAATATEAKKDAPTTGPQSPAKKLGQ